MSFDKLTVDTIAAEMVAAVQPIAVKYGITIRDGGGSYQDLEATLRFKLTTMSETGETVEERAYKQHATLYDLKPEWLGKPITIQGIPFTIAGLCPRRRKNPVLILNQRTGKRHVTTINAVRRFFGEQPVDLLGVDELAGERRGY